MDQYAILARSATGPSELPKTDETPEVKGL
jgi:hypothetical protein